MADLWQDVQLVSGNNPIIQWRDTNFPNAGCEMMLFPQIEALLNFVLFYDCTSSSNGAELVNSLLHNVVATHLIIFRLV